LLLRHKLQKQGFFSLKTNGLPDYPQENVGTGIAVKY
jgi:hypothetical protein